MLRLHPYEYHRPQHLDQALALLARHGEDAMPIAGGTDLVPNMKHGLFTPGHLISLNRLPELRGITVGENEIRIGAAETLDAVQAHPLLRLHLPGLTEAASLVSGPQLRRVGTLGGNICLDTRCSYYNQTKFWRRALGYCLKKDGDTCHVVKGGTRCVAAHSADTPPILMVLGAELDLVSTAGTRSIPISTFFRSDGIWNRVMDREEVLTTIRIPKPAGGSCAAFRKLRARNSIDFPLANMALRLDRAADGEIIDLEVVVSGMGAYPRKLGRVREAAVGNQLQPSVIEAIAEQAFRQCHPLDNMIVDKEWRRAMVPVLVRRTLREMRETSAAA